MANEMNTQNNENNDEELLRFVEESERDLSEFIEKLCKEQKED